jgi:hypothetical protein
MWHWADVAAWFEDQGADPREDRLQAKPVTPAPITQVRTIRLDLGAASERESIRVQQPNWPIYAQMLFLGPRTSRAIGALAVHGVSRRAVVTPRFGV